MNIKNPFITVGYHSPEYFCDREAETAALIEAMENDRNVTLMAPRRYGKTGLIENSFYKLRKDYGYQTIVLDLFSAQNLKDFTRMFASAVFKNLETTAEKALSAATRFLKSCRPTLTIDPSDMSHKFSFDIAADDGGATLSEVFEYLAGRKTRVAIALDEFQQITEFPEKGVEALLRTLVQRVPGVGFVFAGSRQHIMREMFSNAARPFFQSTQKMHLDVIAYDPYLAFAQKWFAQDGRKLEPAVFENIYRRFDGITWYVQTTLNRLYSRRDDSPAVDDVNDVVRQLIGEGSYDYRALVEALPEASVGLLRAIASEGVAREVTSAAFVASHGLKAPSTTVEALDRLVKKELVYKMDAGYVVYDRLFGLWLKDGQA